MKHGVRTIAMALVLIASAAPAPVVAAPGTRTVEQNRAQSLHISQRIVDWPQLGFDSGHSGFNPYEHRIGIQNVGSLQQLWTFTLDNWPGDIVEESGVLYVPSASGELFAVDASNGNQLWEFDSGVPYGWNTGTNGVAVDSGLVFTVCDLPHGAQGLCALQASNGTVQWSYTLGGSSSSAGAPPVVANGIVYFEACASAGCDYVALNESTGAVLWMVSELCSGNLGIPPAVYRGVLYVNIGCDVQNVTDIVALSAQSGSQIWKAQVIGATTGLTVAGGVVAYVRWNGTESYIGALTAIHGQPLWGPSAINSKLITSMPAIAYKQIYAWIFINDYGYIADYDERMGTLNWQYTIARSFPSVANHVVYIAMNGGPLALNAGTGQVLWHISGTDNLGLPIIVNGVVYGGCNGSHVCAYALPG